MVLRTLLVKVGADISDFSRKIGSMGKDVEKHKAKIQKGLNRVSLAVAGVGVAAIKMSMDFNKSMANIATLIPGNIKRVQELKTTIQNMAIETGKATGDIADGAYQVISAFGDTADTVKILETNVKAAAAGMATTTDAINLTSAVMKGYGEVSAETTKKVADLAFQTVKLGQTTFPELAESIGSVVPLAQKLNVSQEELFATFATFTGVTGNASKVATQFEGVLGALIKPTEEMSAAIEGLGYASSEAMVKELGFAGAISTLIEKTDGTAKSIGKLISRKEGLTLAMSMTGAQAEKLNEKFEAMKKSSGAMGEAYVEMTEGINKTGHEFEKFKRKIEVTMQTLGDELAPALSGVLDAAKPLLDLILQLIKGFGSLPSPIKTVVIAMGGLLAASAPLFKLYTSFTAFKRLTGSASLFGSALKNLTSPTGVITTALIALAIAGKRVHDAFVEMGKAIEYGEKVTGKKMSGVEKAYYKIDAAITKFFTGVDKAKIAQMKYSEELEKMKEKYKDVPNILDLGKKAFSSIGDKIKEGIEHLKKYGEASEETGTKNLELIKTIEKFELATKDKLNKELNELVENINKIRSSGLVYNESLKGMIDRAIELADITGRKLSPAFIGIQRIFEELGIVTRTQLVEELKNAEIALAALEKSSEKTPTAVFELKKKIEDLKIELGLLEKVVDTTVPKSRELTDEIAKAPGHFYRYDQAVEASKQKLRELAAQMGISVAEMKFGAYKMIKLMLQVAGISLPSLEGASEETTKKIGIDFKNVAREMTDYWNNAMGEMIREGINASDALYYSFQTMARGAGSVISSLLSSIGGIASAVAPVVGTLVSTIFSGIGSLLGIKSKAQKEAERAAKEAKALERQLNDIKNAMSKYGEISDATAKKIHEASKKMTGFAAVSLYFADIIKDVGINQDNINKLWERAIGIIGNYEQGYLSAAEAAQSANESFKLLLEGAKDLGREGSDAMVAFILRVREAGLEVASVTDYVLGQLNKIPSALTTLIEKIPDIPKKLEEVNKSAEGVRKQMQDLEDEAADLRKELEGVEEGTEEWDKIQTRLTDIDKEWQNLHNSLIELNLESMKWTGKLENNTNAVERMGRMAVHTFNSMIASGMPWIDAVTAMEGPLSLLRQRYEDLGMTADPVLAQLFKIIEVKEGHEKLFNAIAANQQILEALGNTGWLTQEALTDITKSARQYYRQLEKAGIDSETALRQMGPTLQQIYDYAQMYGLELDRNTMKLINQAIELGVVKEKSKEPAEVMQEGFERMEKMFGRMMRGLRKSFRELGDRFEEIMEGVAGNVESSLSGAFEGALSDAESSARDAARNIEDHLGRISPKIDLGIDANLPSGSVKSFQAEGIARREQFAHVAERGPEVIADLSKLQAGQSRFSHLFGRGGNIFLTAQFNINAMDTRSMRTAVRTQIGPEFIQWVKVGLGKTLLKEALG